MENCPELQKVLPKKPAKSHTTFLKKKKKQAFLLPAQAYNTFFFPPSPRRSEETDFRLSEHQNSMNEQVTGSVYQRYTRNLTYIHLIPAQNAPE